MWKNLRLHGLLILALLMFAALRTAAADPERSSDPETMPVVPAIDAAMKSRLRAIYLDGAGRGNRAAVFAKIGDSISESMAFLQDFGCQTEDLGAYASLASTVDYFRAVTFPAGFTAAWCGAANSYNRASAAAVAGWSADSALQLQDPPPDGCPAPYHSALRCELYLLKPGIALIMYGTNDLQRYNDPASYRDHLNGIVTETVAAGVIPVLSTIPPRLDDAALGARVAVHNQVVVEVAQARQVPLWNYWRALQDPQVIRQGIDADGVHPSAYFCAPYYCSGHFTAEGLKYGYNQRNLTAIQVLDKIRRIVLEDGPPDGPAPALYLPLLRRQADAARRNDPEESENIYRKRSADTPFTCPGEMWEHSGGCWHAGAF